jgi:hypothetical protein
MLKVRGTLVAFGLVAVGAGVYAIFAGRIKWSPEKTLHSSQARLVGLAMLIIGAAMTALGLFYPDPLWGHIWPDRL